MCMIVKNNEEKRNQIWKTVMSVSTIVIIIIAAFFVIKLFTANPLEGRWRHEDSSLVMNIKGNGTATLMWPDEFENAKVAVNAKYSIDKETKTFTLQVTDDAIQKAADASDGAVTADGLKSAAGTMEGTYDYSIENSALTLTERDFGEQMLFDKN
jgi:hypothetical protein